MKKEKTWFSYGSLGKTLKEQARQLGFELNNAEKYEKIRYAINMCGFHVATDSQVELMLKKLNDQVVKDLIPFKIMD